MSFKSGEIVEGVVSGITNYGAFIKLPEDKTGLCHISEISNDYVKDIKDYLKEGQEVKVKVLKIKDDSKIELSIKEVNKPPASKAPTDRKPMPKRASNPKFDKPKPTFENMLTDFLKNSDEKLKGIKQRDQRY